MLVYSIAVVVSIRWAGEIPDSPWRYAIALLPMIPLSFALLAFLRFFRQMDELQRKIQFEAVAFGFLATLGVILTYGFLQGAGLPHVRMIFVPPLMIVLWGIGLAIASVRYA